MSRTARSALRRLLPTRPRWRGALPGNGPRFHPWFVAEENERLLGYASSAPFRTRAAYRWIVETGIYLSPDASGRGVGRSLVSALLDLLERQGYVAAIGAIALPNPA